MINREQLPATGALLLPSRLRGGEREALEAVCGRSFTTLTAAQLAAGDVQATREAIQGGQLALFQPGEAIGWAATGPDASLAEIESLLSLGLPIVPLAVLEPLDLAVLPGAETLPLLFSVGTLIPPDQATVPLLQENWMVAAEAAFSSLPILQGHIGMAAIKSLKAHAEQRIHDGSDDSSLTYFEILAISLALAAEIKKQTTKERVGIVLPPGKAGVIANLAVVLAGKVPVNLNFTAGKTAIDSAIRQAEIDKFLTVDIVVRKMQSFPWPPTKDLLLLERLLPTLKGKAKIWGALAKILPPWALGKILGLPTKGDRAEAGLLFTSGSSGEPKGVVLSHRNILANVMQFGGRLAMGEDGSILGCLPLFHSFGFTITTWYPLLTGVKLVTYPSPMDAPKLASLIHKHKVRLFCSTPTFLRGFLRKAEPEQIRSLELLVTGAEKLPASVSSSFREIFDVDVLEGYGLTETAPATNFNLPNKPDSANRRVIPSYRLGSTGPLVPGLAVKVTDPNNNEPLPINQSGMIWFKGANVFDGYLKQPRKTEEVIVDGWFRTGDIGRVDADGFLFIEGRLSRFSKIGGEMVPHETVEEHIVRALNLEAEGERRVAIVGVPDADKGEALVMLSSMPIEGAVKQEEIKLRYALLDRGVPSLWIPKRIQVVQEIPLLASGKLDIKKCEDLARNSPPSS